MQQKKEIGQKPKPSFRQKKGKQKKVISCSTVIGTQMKKKRKRKSYLISFKEIGRGECVILI